jgi:hypothetical protein
MSLQEERGGRNVTVWYVASSGNTSNKYCLGDTCKYKERMTTRHFRAKLDTMREHHRIDPRAYVTSESAKRRREKREMLPYI